MQKTGDWTTEAPFERMDSVWNIGESAPTLKTAAPPLRVRAARLALAGTPEPVTRNTLDFPPIFAALDDRGDLA